MRIQCLKIAAAAVLLVPCPAFAAPASAPEPLVFTYADLADMAIPAPIAAGVEIRRASLLKGAAAAGVRPGQLRYYIEADVKALIRGAGGLPARVSYLADVPMTGANRKPKLRKSRFILLASRVAGKPGELRLIAPQAQIAWTPANEARVREILRAATDPAAPPAITGVGKAFHVPGSLPGESESQIFLATADSRPISLAVIRRPGEAPRWAVSLGEIVDDSAAPPARDSLLWYRLACSLPATLPDASVADMSAEEAAAAAEDYALVIAGLGRCDRSAAR